MATLGDCDSIQTNLTESSGQGQQSEHLDNQSNKKKNNRAAGMKLACLDVTRAMALAWPPKQNIVVEKTGSLSRGSM